MTSIQRVPVIEEVTLSDSGDEIHILEDDHSQKDKNAFRSVSAKNTEEIITNKFPSQNIKLALDQVYLQGDFEVFDVPDSSDDKAMRNSNGNSTSNANKHDDIIIDQDRHNDTNVSSKRNLIEGHTDTDHEDQNDSTETDDEQFYIDEDAKDSNTDCDEPIDLSLTREDESLSSISSSHMSPCLKSDDDKLSTALSGIETSKELNVQNDEEKLNNVFKEDMEIDNATSDDELDSAEEISMPSRNDKQFRVRGKSLVDTICVTCSIERPIQGKLWQNKTCRCCQGNLQFQCVKCRKRYSSYHSTLCHLKKECLSQQFWNCPKCSYSVIEEKKLEEHIKRVHVDGKKARKKSNGKVELFSCDKCNAGFKWKNNYEKHQCREQESYRCQMCDYTSKTKTMIKRHFNNSHLKGSWSKPKGFCKFIPKMDTRPICVPDITSSSNISNETKRKSGEETRAEQKRLNKSIALYCIKCSKKFEYNGTHTKKCEICEGLLHWQCILCDERSKSYCGIYEHLQNSCTAVLKSCTQCSKKFASDDDLKKHQHICGQDLYLQCELCDYKTKMKGFFLKHVKYKHNLENDQIRKWL